MTSPLQLAQKKNEFGHIIKGYTNINNLWLSRDIIVSALNNLNLLLLVKEDNQEKKGLIKIKNNLSKGLTKINKILGVSQ